MAGVDLFTFQEALGQRGISTYTVGALQEELTSLRESFPDVVLRASRQ